MRHGEYQEHRESVNLPQSARLPTEGDKVGYSDRIAQPSAGQVPADLPANPVVKELNGVTPSKGRVMLDCERNSIRVKESAVP